jgi:ABC-type glycerol-3-phosphate transport system substrate-binding protein
MNDKRLTRRDFLRMSALTAAGMALAGCAQPTPETEVVEVEVTRIVEGTPVIEVQEVEVPVEVPVEVTVEVPAAPEEITIEFWNGIGPPEGVLMQDLMNRYEDSQTGIKVEQWTTEWEAFYTKIRTTYAEGIGPDLAVTHPRYLSQYGGTVFQPIDDLIDLDPDVDASLFAKVAWEAAGYDGAQYGLPIDIHGYALYYNVGMLEEAGLDLPGTEAKLIETAKALSEPPDKWGLTSGYQGLWAWMSYMAHRGQRSLLNGDGTAAAFNNDAGIGALQRMYDNIYTDEIEFSPETGLDGAVEFANQNVAFRFVGTWEKFVYDEAKDLRYSSIVFMPEEPGSWGSSHLFVFTTLGTPESRQAAFEAAKSILKNSSAEWAVRAGHIPALLEAAQSEEYLAVEEMQGFRDSVPYFVYLPKVAQHEIISETLGNTVATVLRREKGVEEALSEAEATINKALVEGG